ncbi:MAG: ABC transporter permease subunit [Lachnospiraceae bacterium]|nr:ABC transporter permease subunit [Lachnospiraceae bacterium]
MRAIYKREVKAYLTSMTGYIYMGIFLAFTGLYFTAYGLISGYPEFGYVVSSLHIAFLILTPILTMRSLAEERRQKTDQILLTSPVSLGNVIIGKYLAILTIFTIPMLIISLYPLILSSFGTVSMPMSYTAILGAWLFGAACLAIGLFVSSLTENLVVAAVLTFGVLFFCNMASGISNIISASGILQKVLDAVYIYGKFTNFLNGILDVTGIVYYISVAGLFLFLTVQSLQKRRWS